MSLRKVELVGFKSFMSPVALEFRGGITCIVGPNGCGKTNIVDAVRWVLGEQSAKQLRSSTMDDIIFNGTQLHKPMGYAQIELTIDNEKGHFPLDYSEISICRKVYRSGISEYFINRNPCRLKDIKELFADTGTGSHSYSVIEQEMIDYVLNDAHGERRLMFEEASGIVKYRMRREEAKRKLKLTTGDLLRLEDILEELGKQVRSLKYQVGKARRYKRLLEKVRNWKLVLTRATLSGILVEKRKAESELAEVVDITRDEGASLGSMEKELEEDKVEFVEMEKKKATLQNDRYELRRRIQASEEKVIQSTERRNQGKRVIKLATDEIEQASARLARISEEISSIESNREKVEDKIELEKERIGRLSQSFDKVCNKIKDLKQRVIDLKQTELDFIQNQARAKNNLEHYQKILDQLDTRIAEVREKVVHLEGEYNQLASQKNQVKEKLSQCQVDLKESESEQKQVESEVEEVERKLKVRQTQLADDKTKFARLNSRYELYKKMEENFEGFPKGARLLLKRGDGRIRGALAELVRVEERYRPALEAVLGKVQDSVVVKDFKGAYELISDFLNSESGKVHLLLEDIDSVREDGGRSKCSGMIGKLNDYVEVEPSASRLVEDLLAQTYLFEDVDSAVKFISNEHDSEVSAVTLSGICLNRKRGVYFGGMAAEGVSLLGRSSEIERLVVRIKRMSRSISKAEAECNGLSKEREKLSDRHERIEGILYKLKGNISEKHDKFQQLERECIMKKEKCTLFLNSLEEMENSRIEVLSKLEESKLSLQVQQEGNQAGESAELESRLASRQVERDELESRLTDAKVELASLQGELDKKDEEIRGLRAIDEQFRERIKSKKDEISASRDEIELLDGEIKEQRKIVKDMLEQERILQKELMEMEDSMSEKQSSISSLEIEVKERRSHRETVFTRENEIKGRVISLDTKMGDLIDKAREIYQEDLSCYLDGEEIPLSEEEMSVTDEMLIELEEKLHRMEPVNMAAVEEYEEKNERYDFLLTQKDDLENARNELEQAIRKINRRARKRFVHTFNIVREYFNETFEVLFEGGEARLSLDEGSDPLEADIMIAARPRGKRMHDVSSLSGGERALTALALLFALYKAKPSPFCLLDEVDAPLDEANIRRFVRMLKKFQEETQFIVITHNKGTMEIADKLYGITMEERGVSSVVAVNIADVEKMISDSGSGQKDEVVKSNLS